MKKMVDNSFKVDYTTRGNQGRKDPPGRKPWGGLHFHQTIAAQGLEVLLKELLQLSAYLVFVLTLNGSSPPGSLRDPENSQARECQGGPML